MSRLHPIELSPLPAKPLVSILISNYNYARYLGESMQSALEQTYSNLELIVCDDGSTDESAGVIEQYERRDRRVRLIRKANGGQASGLNAAFAASRGAILALLDSDDLFLPRKVERIVADFQAHPDCGFGVHRVIRVSANHRRQGVWPMSAPLPCGWYGARLLEDGGIEAFIRREVLPYTPDAWIREDAKIGYEVSFTRHFYKPQPLRTLEEISADILAIEKEAEGLLDNLLKGAK